MAQTLLIGALVIAGFVVFIVLDVHGKARAFEHGQIDPLADRPTEAFTGAEPPSPHVNQNDPDQRGSGTR